jgi:hypothetical protein
MMYSAWYLKVSRNVASLSLSLCRRSKSSHDPMKGQAYLDIQSPCKIVVSIKDKFIKLASHESYM